MLKLEHRHALKFEQLSKEHQARTLKKLEIQSRKWAKDTKQNVNPQADVYAWHRRVRVAREARAIHLFRCFLKGTPYKKVEHKLKDGQLDPYQVCVDYMSNNNYVAQLDEEFDKWLNE